MFSECSIEGILVIRKVFKISKNLLEPYCIKLNNFRRKSNQHKHTIFIGTIILPRPCKHQKENHLRQYPTLHSRGALFSPSRRIRLEGPQPLRRHYMRRFFAGGSEGAECGVRGGWSISAELLGMVNDVADRLRR